MQNLYEQLKYFYLGYKENSTIPVLYENKDLTTHALIIGMTGSGKTGLGIGLIEEATLDNIPSIIIDPKGDMGNLLLTFPKLKGKNFEPWVDKNEASNKGLSVQEYAKKIASTWKKGIENSNQDISRIQRLKDNGDFTIYTPGSKAGVGVALLSTFKAPPSEILEDYDLLNTLIGSITTSILELIDIQSDPISGKEHVLISSIFMDAFAKKEDISLQDLISKIVTPPFEKVGVFSLNKFFPQEKRLNLAMKLNTLIASPAFSSWLHGQSLDLDNMLYTKDGKAKVNIFSISHLNDKERMFFVTMLLNNFLGWMRRQEGSSRLRTLLYMDEIYGFFPPSQNPPSKKPMLTLLKQARAFGVGVVLSTQNPVDLDYKGLSNIGTWFIGRLQTKQDKQRVVEGLQGIKGSKYDKKDLMKLLSNIKKRHFLLKNIHEEGLLVFSTRWVLSYLKGPLSRKQIKTLMKDKKPKKEEKLPKEEKTKSQTSQNAPILSGELEQDFEYYSQSKEYILAPFLTCKAKVNFVNNSKNIDAKKEFYLRVPLNENQDQINWENLENTNPKNIEQKARINSTYNKLPNFMLELTNTKALLKEFTNHLYQNQRLEIFVNKALKLNSRPEQSEEAFMVEVRNKLEALKEDAIKKIEEKFEKKQTTLERKLDSAEHKLDKEKSDVSSKTTNTIITIGSSILGAVFGRSLLSRTNIAKVGSSVKSASGILKEKRDVQRAEENIENINLDLDKLQEELQEEISIINEKFTIKNFPNETFQVKPRRADIYDAKISLTWVEE
ncbi:MAG: hypothetical protein CR967_01865 [Proteobacteria bacterium]|nr:MAG: hypothetical protein CR967_01865 [Pseudomonadota bacterium]